MEKLLQRHRNALVVYRGPASLCWRMFSSQSSSSSSQSRTTRVSDSRVYYPGQTYEPEELRGSSASVSHSVSQKTRRVLKRGKELDREVSTSVDWKDAKFLTRFLTETGKIAPRRKTKLQKKTHRLVEKHIKLARLLGVIPFEGRLPQFRRSFKNPYA